MEKLGFQRITFDSEDRPPPSYWQKTSCLDDGESEDASEQNSSPTYNLNNVPVIKTRIDPKEWLKAPEFIPRSKQRLAESFGSDPMKTSLEADSNHNYGITTPPPSIPTSNVIVNGSVGAVPYAPVMPNIMEMPRPVFPGLLPFAFGQPRIGMPQIPTSMMRFPIPRMNPTAVVGRHPLSLVPPGYSANITQINSGIGPPIPALVLKKKRRKRHRRPKISMISSVGKDSSASAHPSDPNGFCSDTEENSRDSTQQPMQATTSEPDLNRKSNGSGSQEGNNSANLDRNLLGGSCPDLSDSQLQLWDNLLYDTIVEEKYSKMETEDIKRPPHIEDVMKRSAYDVCSPAVLSALDSALHVDGITSPQVRELDRQLEGRTLEDSFCEDHIVEKLHARENQFVDSPATTTKSLQAEIEELKFRPTISQYGYPQATKRLLQMETFNPEFGTTTSCIVEKNAPDRQGFVEDCFEGMHIRVNAFDEGDDLALSDSELPEPSRFQQIQWALQRNSKQYAALAPPHRVCCSIM